MNYDFKLSNIEIYFDNKILSSNNLSYRCMNLRYIQFKIDNNDIYNEFIDYSNKLDTNIDYVDKSYNNNNILYIFNAFNKTNIDISNILKKTMIDLRNSEKLGKIIHNIYDKLDIFRMIIYFHNKKYKNYSENISYKIICELHYWMPESIRYIIKKLPYKYGSWNDIIILINIFNDELKNKNYNSYKKPILIKTINYLIKYLSNVIRRDSYINSPSLLANFLPKESSKYSFIFKRISIILFKDHKYYNLKKIYNNNANKHNFDRFNKYKQNLHKKFRIFIKNIKKKINISYSNIIDIPINLNINNLHDSLRYHLDNIYYDNIIKYLIIVGEDEFQHLSYKHYSNYIQSLKSNNF